MYPVTYEADYVEQRDRWTTGFRLLLAIPWVIVGGIYMIGWSVVVLLAWFAMVFTGRYPQGMYNFVSGFLRFYARLTGWLMLQTDEYPSFDFGEHPEYPIRLEVAPPQESYSRLRALFRLIVGIPVMFMAYFLTNIAQFAALAAWFAIVFTGRQPAGLHNTITLGAGYTMRELAYFSLMTETYPPISNQEVAKTIPPAAAETAPEALA
jgi:uncharacterized protein DUF4389